jgi:hypothetical protein
MKTKRLIFLALILFLFIDVLYSYVILPWSYSATCTSETGWANCGQVAQAKLQVMNQVVTWHYYANNDTNGELIPIPYQIDSIIQDQQNILATFAEHSTRLASSSSTFLITLFRVSKYVLAQAFSLT